MANIRPVRDWTDISDKREVRRQQKWEQLDPPVKAEILEVLLNTPYEPVDFWRLLKDDASSGMVKKMISENGEPYDETGQIKPLAKVIAGVLIKKPEVLFGLPESDQRAELGNEGPQV